MRVSWVKVTYVLMIFCIISISGYLYIPRSIDIDDRRFALLEDHQVIINLNEAHLLEKYPNGRFLILQAPSSGGLYGKPPNITYRPRRNFNGIDNFSYALEVGDRLSKPANVQLAVSAVDDPPVAQSRFIVADEDTSLPIKLSASNPDRISQQFSIVVKPEHGNLKGTLPDLIYIPHKDYYGEDHFSFKVEDQRGISDQAEIQVLLFPVNDPPIVNDREIITFPNSSVNICLYSEDPENQPVTLQRISTPRHGIIKGGPSRLVYTPKKNYIGTDRFHYQSSDSEVNSRSAVVKIKIIPTKIQSILNRSFRKYTKDSSVAIGNYNQPDYLLNRGTYAPASVLKIATAAAALHYLNHEQRFKTEVYLDRNRNLYLKGYGDPHFLSEDWYGIAKQLKDKHLFDKSIKDLFLDDTVFEANLDYDGRQISLNYFESPLGALVTNHNTIAVQIIGNGQVRARDNVTPITKRILRRIRGMPKGVQFLNVGKTANDGTFYSGEVAKEIFLKAGATIKGGIKRKPVPKHLRPVLVYFSSTQLKDIVKKMLRDSNNFMANQLLMAIAQEKHEAPVRLQQGVGWMTKFLEENVGFSPCDFNIVEGSGLSPKNKIDIVSILKLVNYFSDHKQILPALQLSKYKQLRDIGGKWQIIGKTGALAQVTNLAGFIPLKNNIWKPFVFMFRADQDWDKCARILDTVTQQYRKFQK